MIADEIAKLAKMHADGQLTDSEFTSAKSKLLSSASPVSPAQESTNGAGTAPRTAKPPLREDFEFAISKYTFFVSPDSIDVMKEYRFFGSAKTTHYSLSGVVTIEKHGASWWVWNHGGGPIAWLLLQPLIIYDEIFWGSKWLSLVGPGGHVCMSCELDTLAADCVISMFNQTRGALGEIGGYTKAT
jgi:hypothetical protein